MTTPRPNPIRVARVAPIVFRRAARRSGAQQLEAVLVDALELPAGTKLTLHRLTDGERRGAPEYLLRVAPTTHESEEVPPQ